MSDSESSKKIESLTLENFTVFENATFEFCPGINVLIGENSTGKTHALKVIYSFLRNYDFQINFQKSLPVQENRAVTAGEWVIQSISFPVNSSPPQIFKFLRTVFNTVNFKGFFRSQQIITKNPDITLSLKFSGNKLSVVITPENFLDETIINYQGKSIPSFVYLPSDEFLSKNEGFLSLYERREIPYSSLYQDLALDLNSLPLREEHLTEVQPILDSLQRIIAGEEWKKSDFIRQENGRFYFELPEGKLDVHLLADGYRKFGMLWYLLRNGSISKNSVLFWDEPETSLNPKLIRELVNILQQLAAIGVQIFIATHDYLLSYELSLLNQYPTHNQPDIKFFSLHKPSRNAGVVVESAKTLAEIAHNPILEAYTAHYDHEADLFYAVGRKND